VRRGTPAILITIVASAISADAFAKRLPPKPVAPMVADGVRYAVPHFGAFHGKEQNGGFVQAWDARKNQLIWDRMISHPIRSEPRKRRAECLHHRDPSRWEGPLRDERKLGAVRDGLGLWEGAGIDSARTREGTASRLSEALTAFRLPARKRSAASREGGDEGHSGQDLGWDRIRRAVSARLSPRVCRPYGAVDGFGGFLPGAAAPSSLWPRATVFRPLRGRAFARCSWRPTNLDENGCPVGAQGM
jgi:hypothetical protein